MVLDPHAVPHPRAVVIHAHDAGFADRAVVSTGRLDFFALVAVTELAKGT